MLSGKARRHTSQETGLNKPMPQWEYRRINLNDVPRKTEDVDLLMDAGRQGWELLAITSNYIAYFMCNRSPSESCRFCHA